MRTLKEQLKGINEVLNKTGETKMQTTTKRTYTKRNVRLTKAQTREARNLYKLGKTYGEVAELMKIGYWQAAHAIAKTPTKRQYTKQTSQSTLTKKTDEVSPKKVDYKAKYLQAVALLIEHDIIEVTL